MEPMSSRLSKLDQVFGLQAIRQAGLLAIGCAILFCTGCSNNDLKEKTYQVSPRPQPVEQVITLLEGYKNGQPVGSEVTGLPALIKDMAEKSGDKTAIVQDAYDKLMTSGSNSQVIATEALEQLTKE